MTDETQLKPTPEESAPATIDQMRGVRRWLVVVAVWATAATAIAVIALIAASDNNDEQVAAATGQIGRVQRQLTSRIDALEGRVDELPQTRDVQRLENRLKEVETAASRNSDRIRALDRRIDQLDQRVESLEQSGTGTETTGTNTTP